MSSQALRVFNHCWHFLAVSFATVLLKFDVHFSINIVNITNYFSGLFCLRWRLLSFPTCIFHNCCLRLVLWLELRHQAQTDKHCITVAVKEKLGGLGKKRTSSKHLWRTNRDAKDSHLCLHNHLLSLSVSVSLALSLIHCSFFTYAPFVSRKIQAWQLRTLGPFGWNICSALAAFYKSAEPRWEQLKQREMVALNKAPI